MKDDFLCFLNYDGGEFSVLLGRNFGRSCYSLQAFSKDFNINSERNLFVTEELKIDLINLIADDSFLEKTGISKNQADEICDYLTF